LKNGLLNASVLDLAMMVLSRSKKAAVRAWGPVVCPAVSEVCCCAAGSETVTAPA
jgi:hypothetical protein